MLGASWSDLRATREPVGRAWEPLGAPLAPLGDTLGLTLASLEFARRAPRQSGGAPERRPPLNCTG
eukprot:1582677-Pyramimonas_sp.AAC.1